MPPKNTYSIRLSDSDLDWIHAQHTRHELLSWESGLPIVAAPGDELKLLNPDRTVAATAEVYAVLPPVWPRGEWRVFWLASSMKFRARQEC